MVSHAMPYFQVENKIKTYLEPPEPLHHVCEKNLAVEGNLPLETKLLFFDGICVLGKAKELLEIDIFVSS